MIRRRALMPAPPKQPLASAGSSSSSPHFSTTPATSFYDLPAELRIEIYKLVLDKVTLHILPGAQRAAADDHPHKCPHALVRTSRQVRNEALPLMHALCPIHAAVTDFDFDGLLLWMRRMPPDQEANLCKNAALRVTLVTTNNDRRGQSSNSIKNSPVLRRWLHLRADRHRPQPAWAYAGAEPDSKTACEMRRRAKRAAKPEEKRELVKMLAALGVVDASDRAFQ